ncbi:MAG: flavodoxin-dependent (E)-4-hydroxy-3-methylbut-2-enyl-diphosphate synthase [Candidatus Susulua stagnicola]|nr:flavodoxin-dependent (E)-4-hydroxy-3-methylbut-2-enyl-diphosphate synthase [Candidatus Susulua stagnicola]
MSRKVKIGNLGIGGKNPVRIKGMLKTPTKDVKGLIKEAKTLEKEGVEAIRVAVRDEKDASVAKLLKKHIKVPLVADIHFHPKLALMSIDQGFESIRLNPMNMRKSKDVKEIAKAAKKAGISIRVGINSGGFKRKFSSPKAFGQQMVKEAEVYLKLLEAENFFDIMVSLKGSDVLSTSAANELFSKKHDYPLHLGITATGPFIGGITKSSLGLGNLLYQGIGDVIRVSLTAPSFWEIRVAKYILQALNLRKFGPEIVSCPTCSRCGVDLVSIVEKFEKALKKEKIKQSVQIAIMGCVVNGPGEAYQADIGAAFGDKKAVIFQKDKIIGQSSEKKIVADLIKEVRKRWK